eukprot:11122702-Ditylum_brightwellii.AAC.1
MDSGLMEEAVKCVVLQTGIMHLSANQTQAMRLSTSYMICNSLLRGEEGLHLVSGAYLDCGKILWWFGVKGGHL